MSAPSPFSAINPKLQLAWDSTSYRTLLRCPREYQLSILEGYRGSSVDLEFGVYFASAVEEFKKARARGASKAEAQLLAVKRVVEDSWLKYPDQCEICQDGQQCTVCDLSGEPTGRGWGGSYEDQWRCKGETKYKNEKGNKAKCPWSHKGHWHPAPAPDVCGNCGSATETHRRYVPNDKIKNRETLVRLVSWYCEEQPDDYTSGLHPVVFEDGRVASELSWQIVPGFKARTGEPFILTGHLDSIMTNGQETFIADNKTTKSYLGKPYWKQFNPNAQIDLYDLAGTILYPALGIRGVIIEAAQVMANGARFGMGTIYKNDAQRDETLEDIQYWLGQAEAYAEANFWPMNKTNCKLCTFQSVCSVEPAKRKMYLEANFEKRFWNPLEER